MSANTNPIYYTTSTDRDGHLVSGLNTTHVPLNDSTVKTVQSFNGQRGHSIVPFSIPLDPFGLSGVPTGRTVESVSLVGTLQGSGNGTGVKFEAYEVATPVPVLDPTWRDIDSDINERWNVFSSSNNSAHIDECILLDSELTVSASQSNLTFDVSSHSLLDGVTMSGTINVEFLIRVDDSVKVGWGNFFTDPTSSLRWRLVITYSGSQPTVSPEISTSSPLSFGEIETNQSSEAQEIEITNEGIGTLSISSVSITGDDSSQFSIDSDTGETSLEQGETRTVSIVFAPDSGTPEAKSANLRIVNNDSDENPKDVALSGTEIDPIPDIAFDPSSINFGVIQENESSPTFEVTISNTGHGDLNFTSVSLIGDDADQFTIVSDTAEDPLATSEARTVGLRYDPDESGSHTAYLEIVSDDPDEDTVLVSLSGIASDAPSPEKPLLYLGEGDYPEASDSIFFDILNDQLVLGYGGVRFGYGTVLNDPSEIVGVTEFTSLTDCPPNYSGASEKIVSVKSDESGLEFIDPDTLTITSTDDIPTEGGNLWFSIERAQDAIADFLTEGSGVSLTHIDASNSLTIDVEDLSTSNFASANVSQWTNDAAYVTASHSHNASAITSGTLPIARGGTNGTSFTSNTVTVFNGTSLVSLANGSDGEILKLVSGSPSWESDSGILTVDWGDIIGTLSDQTDLQSELDDKADDADVLKKDGSVALTSDWDAGSFEIRALTFESDQTTGTAPFTIASTTVVTNLNADTVDGIHGSAFLKADGSTPLTGAWDVGSFQVRAETFQSDVTTGTAPLTVASTTVVTNLNADLLDGNEASAFQTSDATLTALAGLNSTAGIVAQTGADAFTKRTITGTSNRISLSNGDGASGNPTIDIDSAYVGQTSITTLGTVATGTWSGTAIGATKGGTSFTTVTTGDIIYGSATNTWSKLAVGTNGHFLTLTAGIPAWSALPITATANGADNRIATYSSSSALNGEANLTFDGSTLALTGDETISGELKSGSTHAIHFNLPGLLPSSTTTLYHVVVPKGMTAYMFLASVQTAAGSAKTVTIDVYTDTVGNAFAGEASIHTNTTINGTSTKSTSDSTFTDVVTTTAVKDMRIKVSQTSGGAATDLAVTLIFRKTQTWLS